MGGIGLEVDWNLQINIGRAGKDKEKRMEKVRRASLGASLKYRVSIECMTRDKVAASRHLQKEIDWKG